MIAAAFEDLESRVDAIVRPVTEAELTDMSLDAMSPTIAGESPAGAKQRREYAARGHRQARYAMRGSR